MKSSALETDVTAVEPSGEQRGGKDEEVKLLDMFLARCQKSFGELEFARLLHFLWMKEFLVSRRIDLARFRAEIYSA